MPRRPTDRQLRLALAARIKQARTDKGWTREEVAEALDLTPETIWKYETGRITIPLPSLRRLSRALSVDYAWLLGVKVPGLDKEQLRLLEAWGRLTEEQKRAVLVVLRGMGRIN